MARELQKQAAMPPVNAAIDRFAGTGFPWSWQEAADLAADKHCGQKKQAEAVPYIAHPVRVALIVSCSFGCCEQDVVAAALLHDVLEKTDATSEWLRRKVGTTITGMVECLSKNHGGPESGYWDRLTAASWQIRLIKMADALDHLDCRPGELPRRLKSGNKALELAFSPEEPLQRAKVLLKRALDAGAMSLERSAKGG
jgi:(p)ppGpp synthase/HD superfamily hydrolase